MRSESTSALGQPSDTMPTFFWSGIAVVVAVITRAPLHLRAQLRYPLRRALASGRAKEGQMDIFAVNWLAVLLAALAGFVVGGIWYGPIMGKRWMGAVGLTEEQAVPSRFRCWPAGPWRIRSQHTRRI
jgi:hypothetical protein